MDCVVGCPTEDEMNKELELYLIEKYALKPELGEIARKIYQQGYHEGEKAGYDEGYEHGCDKYCDDYSIS